ncbi:MAG: glycosyltransferase family 4 protein [Gaiellaceae bacterium]
MPTTRATRVAVTPLSRTLVVTSALPPSEEAAVAVVLSFARRFGEEVTLRVAVAGGGADDFGVLVTAAAVEAGIELELDIELVECSGPGDIVLLLETASAVAPSGCAVLAAESTRLELPLLGTGLLLVAPEAEPLATARRVAPDAFVTSNLDLAVAGLGTPGIGRIGLLGGSPLAAIVATPLARSLDCIVVEDEDERETLLSHRFDPDRVVAGSGLPLAAELALAPRAGDPPQPFADAPLDVAFVSPYALAPPMNGGAVRISELWAAMPAQVGGVAFSLTGHGHPGHALYRFTRARRGRELQLRRPPAVTLASSVLGAATGASCDDVAAALVLDRGDDLVDALAAAHAWRPDAVVVAHAFLVRQARLALPDVPLVYDSHNVESLLKDGMYADSRESRRVADAVRRLEAEACTESALVIACSDDDRQMLHELFELPLERCEVVPNGVAVGKVAFVPWEARRGRPRCAFAGSDHGPNVEAALDIVAAARALPHVDFDLVGTVNVRLRPGLPSNVVAHGRIDDATKAAVFAQATLSLNPMRGGSGSNLKIVDYAASGLPVVTTPFGARGFSDELVGTFAVYEGGSDALVDAVRVALGDDWAERTVSAREICEREYDWAVLAQRYAEILRRRFGGRG